MEQFCCHSRNPAIQVLHVVMVIGGYYLYGSHILAYLPQPYAPAWHE